MEIVVLVVGALILAVAGVRVGMLLAPRIERWGTPREPEDKEATTDDRH